VEEASQARHRARMSAEEQFGEYGNGAAWIAPALTQERLGNYSCVVPLSPYRRGYDTGRIVPVLTAGMVTRLAVREATRDRSVRNNACDFPKARPFGSNNVHVLTSSDISP